MSIVRPIWMIVVFSTALLGTQGASLAQTGAAVGVGGAWPWPVYGPYGPYPYGGYAPWAPCAPGLCVDSIELRRAVRREIRSQELRRELEQRAGDGSLPAGGGAYGVRRDPPPPTPESEMQPRYRGSGEVRPEYRDTGRTR